MGMRPCTRWARRSRPSAAQDTHHHTCMVHGARCMVDRVDPHTAHPP